MGWRVFEGKDQIRNIFGDGTVVMFRNFKLAALAASNIKKCPVRCATVGSLIVQGLRIKGDWKTFFAVIRKVKAVVEGNVWHRVFLYKLIMKKIRSFSGQEHYITQFTAILTLF